jgi:hypothetical protein
MNERAVERWLVELRGPRPWTEGEGRRVIDAWSRSGETVSTFARRAGLGARRVYWWRERLGITRPTAGESETPVAGPAFLPVVVRAAPATSKGAVAPVTVCTRGGVRVEVATLDGVSALWIATLVRSLEEVSS